MALPANRPVAPPMAAPVPIAPPTDPRAAPTPAPNAVPRAALPIALLFDAWAEDAPSVCWNANPRQLASSPWKASKDLPCAGSAITVGPWGGATAQALSARTDTRPMAEIARLMFQVPKMSLNRFDRLDGQIWVG